MRCAVKNISNAFGTLCLIMCKEECRYLTPKTITLTGRIMQIICRRIPDRQRALVDTELKEKIFYHRDTLTCVVIYCIYRFFLPRVCLQKARMQALSIFSSIAIFTNILYLLFRKFFGVLVLH